MYHFKSPHLALSLMLAATLLIACQKKSDVLPTTPMAATVTFRDDTSIFDGNDELNTTLIDSILLGETVTAVLDDPAAAHNWLFQGTAGQTVTITVTSPVDLADPAVVLLDPTGNIMTQVDDNFGPDDEDVQITVTLPQEGTYTIRITTFGGGEYQITVQ
jgi:hypothetical protein